MKHANTYYIDGHPGHYRLINDETGIETLMGAHLTKEQADAIADMQNRTSAYVEEGERLAKALDRAFQAGDKAAYNDIKFSIDDWMQREP